MLNSISSGVISGSLKWKWMKDWKSDAKNKASRLWRHAGGGPSMGAPLTALEERLLEFLGEAAVSGVIGVITPITATPLRLPLRQLHGQGRGRCVLPMTTWRCSSSERV